jgi:hypothetical protein
MAAPTAPRRFVTAPRRSAPRDTSANGVDCADRLAPRVHARAGGVLRGASTSIWTLAVESRTATVADALPVTGASEPGYRTAFELGNRWSFIAIEVAAIVMLLVVGIAVARRSQGGTRTALVGFLAVLALVIGAPTMRTMSDISWMQDEVAAGRSYVVDGAVTGFSPGSWVGHRTESFSVQGAYFEYSAGIISGAFNETSDRGGPVRADGWLRVMFVRDSLGRNRIVRLDIRLDAPGE